MHYDEHMTSTPNQIAERLLVPLAHDVAIGLHSWNMSEALPKNPDVFKAMAHRQFTGQENPSMVRSALAIMSSHDPASARLLYTRWWQAGGDTRKMLSLSTLRIPEMENALAKQLREQTSQVCSIYQDTIVPLLDELTLARRTPLPDSDVDEGMEIISRLAGLAYGQNPKGVSKISQQALETLIERSFIVAPSWGWQSGYNLTAVGIAIDVFLRAGATVYRRKSIEIESEGYTVKTQVPDLVCEALLRSSAGTAVERNSEIVIGALASEDENWLHTWNLAVGHPEWQARLDQLRRSTPVLLRQRLAQESHDGPHATDAGARM